MTLLVVITVFVIVITVQVVTDKQPPPSLKKKALATRIDTPNLGLLEIPKGPDGQPQKLEVVRLPREDSESTDKKEKVPEKVVPADPPVAPPVAAKSGGKKVRHDLDWYRPFDGGFWDEFPAAKAILQKYVEKAARMKADPSSRALSGGYVNYVPMAEMCNQVFVTCMDLHI